MLRTPVFSEYEKYGAKLVEFGGFEMPIQFSTSIIEEHNAVRNFAGLFDVSHMGEILVNGPDAEKFVNYIITNDVSKLGKNNIFYSFICYENGGIVDDILVYRLAEEKILLVVNASNTDKDFEYILKYTNGFDVEIKNISNELGQLAIQGPFAERILQKFTDTNLSEIKNFTFLENVNILNVNCLVSRTGYTGEDGFEIYMQSDKAAYIYSELLKYEEDGKKLLPIGLGARDTLRFESGMPLYGNELSKDTIAVEVGFNFAIKLDKEDFIGKDALLKAKADIKHKLVGLELLEKGIPRHSYKVEKDGKEIGYITTGYFSPTLNKAIAMAFIDSEYAKINEEVFCIIRNKKLKSQIINKKFR